MRSVSLEIEKKNLDESSILLYSPHQEVPVEIDKKEKDRIVTTMKKTLPKSMVDQMLSMRDIVTQMFVKSEGTPLGTLHSQSDGTPMSTRMCTPMGTLMGTLMGKPISNSDGTLKSTPNCKSDGTPVFKFYGASMGSPPEFLALIGRIFLWPLKEEGFFHNEPKQVRNRFLLGFQVIEAIRHYFWKTWIKLSIPHLLFQKWNTKIRVAHQDKMVEFVEVNPEKSATVRNLCDRVKLTQDDYSKNKPSQGFEPKRDVSKLLMLDELQENEVEMNDDVQTENYEDDVKNRGEIREEIFEVFYDVCDYIAEGVVSSYNSPGVKMHGQAKASLEGEIDEEPGGNVSARSRSIRFRSSSA